MIRETTPAARWGMLSTADIGRTVAAALRSSQTAELVAVAGRHGAKAAAFAAELGIPTSYGCYDALLADDSIDAVYIPLPNTLHAEWTIRALRAGKHVLCEKPFALTPAEVDACFDAADAADRWCIEGFMWRLHPQTLLTSKLLADGVIGDLATVRASLTVDAPAGNIRRRTDLGGGALWDLGCYCVSAIRLFAGRPAAVGATQIVDPLATGEGHDLRMVAHFTMPRNVLGQLDVGLDLTRRDLLELVGTRGRIVVPDPWLCRAGYVTVVRDGHEERFEADPSGEYGLAPAAPHNTDAYRIEFEAASHAITTRQAPRFGRADAAEQAEVIDAVRRSATARRTVELTTTV
ncbi:Gfo/Idh/MocA family protein [Tsukamurella soli]|uniref:Gfo/Idh/MocA family oxidoreductase n=1 Tax=Tsukamurella soli TaxID=644556 RepID=A0ABP8JID7_9ACTN